MSDPITPQGRGQSYSPDQTSNPPKNEGTMGSKGIKHLTAQLSTFGKKVAKLSRQITFPKKSSVKKFFGNRVVKSNSHIKYDKLEKKSEKIKSKIESLTNEIEDLKKQITTEPEEGRALKEFEYLTLGGAKAGIGLDSQLASKEKELKQLEANSRRTTSKIIRISSKLKYNFNPN